MTIPSAKGERNALGTYRFVFGWKFKLNTKPYNLSESPCSH